MCATWLTRNQPIYIAGNETPVLVVGIIASVLLAAGLLPPYVEIHKRRGRVVGINWVRRIPAESFKAESGLTCVPQVFLTMDWNGAFFSLMALGTYLPLLECALRGGAGSGWCCRLT